MPDGQTHQTFNKRYTPLTIMLGAMLALLPLSISFTAAVLYFCGYLIGLLLISRWCDPDLDQLGMTAAEGRALNDLRKVSVPRRGWRRYPRLLLREVGGLIGFLWVWWMMPYAYIMRYFGGHRGLSHVYVLGTITRVVWAFWPLYAVYWWYYMPWIGAVLPFTLGCFLGLCMMDILHIWLDNHYGKNAKVRTQ